MTPPPITDWADRDDTDRGPSGSENQNRRARSIRWLLCDVDGVLTDGRLTYTADGELTKVFHAKDGLALKLAQRAGIKVGWLTARGGPAVERRARDLGIDELITGRHDKADAFAEFRAKHQVDALEVAYVGDDLVDLPVLLTCGLSFAPADAAGDVQSRVDRVVQTPGGYGAVREIVEWLLGARGQWQGLVQEFASADPAGGQDLAPTETSF